MITSYNLTLTFSVLFVFVIGLLLGQYVKTKRGPVGPKQERKLSEIRRDGGILTVTYILSMLVLSTGG